MKALILTEGGKNIGFGHITRCIALCQVFEEKGIVAELIINTEDNIEEMVGGKNYQAFNWFKERDRLLERLDKSDIVIVDSYLANMPIYANISNIARIPVYLDDTRRLEYPRGIVLNGSFYAEDLHYPKKDGVEYLLGIQYAILRKEFREVPAKKINKDMGSVMVTFGGADTKNMTLKILDFLNKKYSYLRKLVIIGKSFQNVKDIEMKIDKNTELIYFPTAKKMKEIMLISDIAISSGGQTLYELARVGVSTIGICVAENQTIGLEKLQTMDLMEYAGMYDDHEIEEKLKMSIKSLTAQGIREARSKRGRKLVDGRGAERIAKIIKVKLETGNGKNRAMA